LLQGHPYVRHFKGAVLPRSMDTEVYALLQDHTGMRDVRFLLRLKMRKRGVGKVPTASLGWTGNKVSSCPHRCVRCSLGPDAKREVSIEIDSENDISEGPGKVPPACAAVVI